MANRNTLAISKLEEFKEWLIEQGVKPLKPKGCYEVLRWKSDCKGEAMPVIFQKDSATVHLSCNESAYRFVKVWIRNKKELTDTIIVDEGDKITKAGGFYGIKADECNCEQALELKDCNIKLRSKIGELESKSLIDDETISKLKSQMKDWGISLG